MKKKRTKNLIANMDLWLLLMTIVLAVFGLIMVYTASSFLTIAQQGVPSNYYFIKQAIFTGVSLFLSFVFVIRIKTDNYKYLAPIAVLLSIASLVGLFLYGFISNGAKSWYDLGPVSFQPSEIAKAVLIVYLGVAYNRLILKKDRNPYHYLYPLIVGIIMFVLVLMQPDAGSALIIAGITALIFFAVPIPKYTKNKCYKIIAMGLLVGVIGLMLFGKSIFSSRQLNRLNFQSPCSRYRESSGYQVCNGFIAIKNGGIFGVGLGNSTQKYLYLPEAHTDFIYPIIVEELGLIGGILVIIAYVIMLYRILVIARRSKNTRNALIAYGVFAFILLHVVINLVGILALAPLTGVPLPLLSYGGSFDLSVIIMLFVVQRIAIENNEYENHKRVENI